MRTRRYWRGAAGVVLGMACLAGCQTGDKAAGNNPAPPMLADDGVPDLKPAQKADVRFALGRGHEKKGDLAQAVAVYREVVREDPNHGGAYLRLAVLHDKQGKFKESHEFYEKAIKASPGNPDVFCSKGYSCYLQQRYPEAEMILRQAIALVPDHPRAHNNLGLVLAHTGRADEALHEFRKGGCSEADAYCNVAFALTLERRWPEARQNYARALIVAPTSAQAKKGLEDLEGIMAKAESYNRNEAAAEEVVPTGFKE